MERVNAVFLAAVLAAAGVGAAATAGYGGSLQARDASVDVVDAVEADVTSAAVRDGRLELTVTVTNPTDHDLAVTGAAVRVHNRTDRRLASGSAERLSGGTDLPAGGSLTATYAVRVSPSNADALQAALAADAAVTIRHGVRLRSVTATVTATDRRPNAEAE